jgi:predicted GH43/DUF377 family glycosyl hydrolase
VVSDFCWNYGAVRGGTPAQLVEDEYLAFFHSSNSIHGGNIATYFMGAFTFSKDPPFRVTRMSREPIVDPTFNDGWTYRNIDYVIFPISFHFDDQHIFVTYGKNEKEGWVMRMDRRRFFASLRNVSSVVVGDSDWDAATGRPDVDSFAYTAEGEELCPGKSCESWRR